jgi:hypothetical protein
MRRVLYHRTTAENAEIILRDKFCVCGNHEHHRGAHGVFPGVWLSSIPLLVHPRFIAPDRVRLPEYGTAMLEVVIDATGAFMEDREWKKDPLYGEWLIEASELNARILSIRKLTVHEAAEAAGTRAYSLLEFLKLREDDFARADLENANPLKALAQIMRLRNG